MTRRNAYIAECKTKIKYIESEIERLRATIEKLNTEIQRITERHIAEDALSAHNKEQDKASSKRFSRIIDLLRITPMVITIIVGILFIDNAATNLIENKIKSLIEKRN